jgi:propionyl-CoA synthetase
MNNYREEFLASVDNPEKFWLEKSQKLSWFKPPQTILSEDPNGVQRWFADGELNTCFLAVDVHIENGLGEKTALIYDSPVTCTKRKVTYTELKSEVESLAGALKGLGLSKGDTAIIYMPMIPQAVFAMLACARLGVIHSVVFGGFAAKELAVRIDDAEPNVILTASCGVEPNKTIAYKPLIDEGISLSKHKPNHVLLFQRPELKASLNTIYLDWIDLVSQSKAAECVPVKATDPLYILYTSGTTGLPKGIVRDNGGHAVAMKYSMEAIYDIAQDEVFWAASDVGWVVGHSYIVYAPLIHGCTTVLYEGKPVGTPDAGAFWRVIEEYGIKALFAAPTAFRAIKKQDPEAELLKKYDLTSLKSVFVAGERLDPPTYYWLENKFQRPIIDHWWQTETGWAIAANMLGIEHLPSKAGSSCVPTPGFNVEILDDDGNILPQGEHGNIAIKLPLPPSCLPTLWKSFDRFKENYLDTFPGYYLSGDGGYFDEQGYLFIMGRIDDVINTAGHRMSTGRMEEVVASHPAVAECAVVGINDSLKGQLPIAFIILKDGESSDAGELSANIVDRVREQIGTIACLNTVYIVNRVPKTRSGKILRKVIRQIANGEEYVVPSTIDDPICIDEFIDLLSS